MSDTQPPRDSESFFRKVVRFVANPATDWADLNSRQDEGRDLNLEKSELKAMIERKKRNDFVRKREFDMLRKVRREGLSPEQLAALGGSSRLDDSEARGADSAVRPVDTGVKAKIDEIEQQMVADGFASSSSRKAAGILDVRTRQQAFPQTTTRPAVLPRRLEDSPPAEPPPRDAAARAPVAAAVPVPAPRVTPPQAAEAVPLGGLQGAVGAGFTSPFSVEVSEVVHDPELDEAVIAFANADFEQCESALSALTRVGGARAQHAETWLVLFDLYRATGKHQRFEGLALEYAHQFGWSAPQWFSMPKLVAESAQQDKPSTQRVAGEIGWICPENLDVEAVARLRSVTLQLPLPWVFDWSALRSVEAEAATQLSALFRHWSGEALDMRWLSGDRFLSVLRDAAPTGVRDADPAYWVLRLDALRLANRADQFDEAAIDYCVTYEVSPPSWERVRCQVRIGGSGLSTQSPPLSQVGAVATSFLESAIDEHTGAVTMASVELSGQLVGDISATLRKIDAQLAAAPLVTVSCAKLIRVDFLAAGDLLNWVLAKRGESRSVTFADAHRLVALFFGAMGINEHASVRVRNN